jgi:hypothetical protein
MAYGSWTLDPVKVPGVIREYPSGTVTKLTRNSNIGYTSRSGMITPGFGKVKRLGSKKSSSTDLPVNPFHFEKRVENAVTGNLTSKLILFPEYRTVYSGSALADIIPFSYNISNPEPETLDGFVSRAGQIILEKLKNQSVNLAQVFAERKMTADLIGSTAYRFAGAMLQLRRGDILGAARKLGTSVSRKARSRFISEYRKRNGGNAIADGWLELQYGWRPLLQDIYGSAEFLAKKQTHEIRGRVNSSQKRNCYETREIDSQTTLRTNFFFEVGESVWFQTSGAELASAKESGLTNPLSVAWEVLPWSFVVDWFIPVGGYINRLDATLGLSFQRGSLTIYQKGTLVQESLIDGSDGIHQYNGWATGDKTLVDVTRVKLEEFPGNQFPGFKNPYSFEHALNAIALLTQVFTTKKI